MGSKCRASSFFLLLLLFLFASLPCWKPAAAASSPGRWTAACNETEGGGGRCRVEVEVKEEEDAEEFQFDSEINRRLLAARYPTDIPIYEALDAEKTACRTMNGMPSQCGAPSGNKPPPRVCNQMFYRCPNPPTGS